MFRCVVGGAHEKFAHKGSELGKLNPPGELVDREFEKVEEVGQPTLTPRRFCVLEPVDLLLRQDDQHLLGLVRGGGQPKGTLSTTPTQHFFMFL